MTRLDPTDDNVGFVTKSTQQGDKCHTHLQAVPTLFLKQETVPSKGLSHEMELAFDDMMVSFRPKYARRAILVHSEFIIGKVQSVCCTLHQAHQMLAKV